MVPNTNRSAPLKCNGPCPSTAPAGWIRSNACVARDGDDGATNARAHSGYSGGSGPAMAMPTPRRQRGPPAKAWRNGEQLGGVGRASPARGLQARQRLRRRIVEPRPHRGEVGARTPRPPSACAMPASSPACSAWPGWARPASRDPRRPTPLRPAPHRPPRDRRQQRDQQDADAPPQSRLNRARRVDCAAHPASRMPAGAGVATGIRPRRHLQAQRRQAGVPRDPSLERPTSRCVVLRWQACLQRHPARSAGAGSCAAAIRQLLVGLRRIGEHLHRRRAGNSSAGLRRVGTVGLPSTSTVTASPTRPRSRACSSAATGRCSNQGCGASAGIGRTCKRVFAAAADSGLRPSSNTWSEEMPPAACPLKRAPGNTSGPLRSGTSRNRRSTTL